MIQQSLSDNDRNNIVADLQGLVVNSICSWLETARFLPDTIGVDFMYTNNSSRCIKTHVSIVFEKADNPLKMG